MHDYDVLDSRVLVHVSAAFFFLMLIPFVQSQVLVGLHVSGVASLVVADGV